MTRLDWVFALGSFALLILCLLIVVALEWWDGYRARRAELRYYEWLREGAHELVAGHGARGEPEDAVRGSVHETPRDLSFKRGYVVLVSEPAERDQIGWIWGRDV